MLKVDTVRKDFTRSIITDTVEHGPFILELETIIDKGKVKSEALTVDGPSYGDCSGYQPVILTKEELAYIKKHNPFSVREKSRDRLETAIFKKIYANDAKAVFNAIVKGTEDEIVYLRSYDHSFYVFSEEKMLHVYRFDYIEGNIDNENFHLEELFEYVKMKAKTDPNYTVDEDLEIMGIPHYNADRHRNQFFVFSYCAEVPEKKKDSFLIRTELLSALGFDKYRKPPRDYDKESDDE